MWLGTDFLLVSTFEHSCNVFPILGALEGTVLRHPDVVDCAVVGLNDKLKGQVPLAICVLGDG